MSRSPERSPAPAPLIFLAGPPGAGKSTLGARACGELGLTFCDLDAVASATAPVEVHRRRLDENLDARTADVVALSWVVQQDPAALRMACLAKTVLLLWAHPEAMQARSGRAAPS